jgi:DNA invertase Pin-like site-specific DNA recombinase
MRAIIYTRVSSDKSGYGRSVSEQEKECRAICERNDWPVAEVLSDNDIGASRWSRKDRPAYKQLASTLRRGDVLVTWEASRAQRDLKAYVQLAELCANRGVKMSYGGRVFDLESGDDRFTTGLDALLAAKEADLNRDRAMRTVIANAGEGKPHGKIAYGYRAKRNPDTGVIEKRIPHEEHAPIVQEIAGRIIAGESLYAIAKDLTARGVPPAGKATTWRGTIIARMMVRPTYAGLRGHRDAVIPSTHWEPLITVEQHEAIVAILRDPSRRTVRGTGPKHLLSGIARCSICQTPVQRQKVRDGVSVYMCPKGAHVGRRQGSVDDLITKLIIKRLSKPDALEALGAAGRTGDGEDAHAAAEKLRGRLRDAAAEYAADPEGTITLDMLKTIKATIQPRIDELDAKARSAYRSPLLEEIVGPNAAAVWKRWTIIQRRDLIRSILEVEIRPQGRGSRFDPERIRIRWIGADEVRESSEERARERKSDRESLDDVENIDVEVEEIENVHS